MGSLSEDLSLAAFDTTGPDSAHASGTRERTDGLGGPTELALERNIRKTFARGNAQAQRGLVASITPVILARVRAITRHRPRQTLGLEFDVDDVTQEVLARLFENGARVLLRWDPRRGMSLRNYVGMVTERATQRLLRRHWRSCLEQSASGSGSESGGCLEFDIPDPTPGPEELLASRELVAPGGVTLSPTPRHRNRSTSPMTRSLHATPHAQSTHWFTR